MVSGGDGDKNQGFSNLQTALVTAVTNVFANMQSSSSRSNDSRPSSSKAFTRATVTHTSDDDFEKCAKRFRKFSFMSVANNVRHPMLFLELPMFESNDLMFVFRTLPSKFSRRIQNDSGTLTGKKRIYERDIILLHHTLPMKITGKNAYVSPEAKLGNICLPIIYLGRSH